MQRVLEFSVRTEQPCVNAARGFFGRLPFPVQSLQFRTLLFRYGSGIAVVVFVRREDADKVRIQQPDNFLIGERTRPQRKRTASAPAGRHSTIVSEKEDRAVALLCQLECGADVRCPADFVQPAFPVRRGAERHALLDFVRLQRAGAGGDREQQKED